MDRRAYFAGFILFVIFLISFVSQSRSKRSVIPKSRYDQETGRFFTEGSVVLPTSFEKALRICGDFASYRNWALTGINGRSDNPREFLVLIKDMKYILGSDRKNYLKVIYDLDIPVFKQVDKALYFDLLWKVSRASGHAHYTLKLTPKFGTNIALRELRFSFTLAKVSQRSVKIDFESRTRFSSFVNVFFSMDRYEGNVEWRISKVIENFIQHIFS